jgi:Dyp-type peroxidase family
LVSEADVSLTLELEEIQGLITSGYGERPTARYALFEIIDRDRARTWLKALLPSLQFSEYRRSSRNEPPFLNALCTNIAFTHAGFSALGLPGTALSGFSASFQEGLAEPNRARRLGDDGASAPDQWRWGRPGEPLHGMLAVFAGTDDADPDEWQQIDACILSHLKAENGVRALRVLDTMPANRLLRKEPFGFRDGIANPRLSGLSAPDAADIVADGEILLGYKNGYDRLPLSPELSAADDPHELLPQSAEARGRRDFGKNGSYLVFRQLEQDVQGFWRYVHEAKQGIPDALGAGDDWLAAKLVGRWRNGTPLTRYPEHPGPEDRGEDNAFLFGEHDDAFGTRCPIGSHIRRTNPRDTALPVPHDPELSGTPEDPEVRKARLKLADLHRILRRGRPYGEPLSPTYDPEAMRAAQPGEGGERGIHFLCFNANLSRQFEFVQSNWALNPTFAGLSDDPDPLLCAGRQFPFRAANFTIPGLPVRRVKNLPRVVEVRGGAYFFMPSKSALRYLSEL